MDSSVSGHELHERAAEEIASIRFAVVTLSDTRTPETDDSGKWIVERLTSAGHEIADYRIVADEETKIREQLREYVNREFVDIVITTGGTGISARDVTCEVVSELIEKQLDGFGELFRMLSWQQIGAAAMLSRAVAGTTGRTAIFALPGSTKAVQLGVDELILPQAKHVVRELHKQ